MDEVARAHTILSIRAGESRYVVSKVTSDDESGNNGSGERLADVQWMHRIMRQKATLHTYLSAINHYDRAVSRLGRLDESGHSLLRVACAFVAIKHDEMHSSTIEEMQEASGLTAEAILSGERSLCRLLDMDLIFTSSVYFIDYMTSMLAEGNEVRDTALSAVEIFTFSAQVSTYPSSCVATCALWIARRFHSKREWTHLHVVFCGYTTHQLQPALKAWNAIPQSSLPSHCVEMFKTICPVSVWPS